jgi:hypothetical protein
MRVRIYPVHVIAGLVPAIHASAWRKQAPLPWMAGTMAGHDGFWDGEDPNSAP